MRLRTLLTVACLCLSASIAWAAQDDRRRQKDPIDDLVAVTVTDDGRAIVIATPALPEFSFKASFGMTIRASEWRVRILRVPKKEWGHNGVSPAVRATSRPK